MKLEWLATVLRPSDVAPNRRFPDLNYDHRPNVVLAAAIDGRGLPPPAIFEEEEPSEQYDALESKASELAVQTFYAESQRAATTDLVGIILENRLDPAAGCALALVATSALAELEEIDLIERLLGFVLARTRANNPASRLLRACALQQLKLRRQDWGFDDRSLSVEATQLIRSLTGAKFPDFPVNRGVGGGSSSTVDHMVAAMRYAVWSTTPPESSMGAGDSELVGWKEIVFADWPEEVLLVERERASTYASYVESAYGRAFDDRSTYWGRGEPDLFYVNLRNELYGSGSVYGTRKELALLRLLEAPAASGGSSQAECLRYLRYGKGDSHLTLALETLELGGPLASISEDARRVIRRRLTPRFVRSEDLQVVGAGADLLTEAELRPALTAAMALLDEGSPTNDPGRWSAATSRVERTWRAVASIANAANAVAVVSERLLRDIQSSKFDELLDRAYARTVRELEWDGWIERDAWLLWLESSPVWEVTAQAARLKLGMPLAESTSAPTRLRDAADIANDLLSGREVERGALDASVGIISDALRSIRDRARTGTYGRGGVEPAELAAVFVEFDDASLWSALTDFTLDLAVPRDYKTAALDRLAVSTPPMPPDIRIRLSSGSDGLVRRRDSSPFVSEVITPYPAALRFLGAYQIISDDDLMADLYELTGSRSPLAHEEAAKTVAVIAAGRADAWLLGIALQLSYERNPRAQGYASNALALMVGGSPEYERASRRRLIELLRADSLIAPLLAIRGLGKNPRGVDHVLRLAVQDIADGHPSRRVRNEATKLLSSG